MALVIAVLAAAMIFFNPSPTERVADVVRAVSSDTASFKFAEDDEIANSVSKVCSTQAAIGNSRPGPMMWAAVVEGSAMHPEAVSRADFVEAINDFCESER